MASSQPILTRTNNADIGKPVSAGAFDTALSLEIMHVGMITRLMDMTMDMDVIFFTSMDMTVINFIENGGGMAEKIPIVRNYYLAKIEVLQNFNQTAGSFWIKVVGWFI